MKDSSPDMSKLIQVQAINTRSVVNEGAGATEVGTLEKFKITIAVIHLNTSLPLESISPYPLEAMSPLHYIVWLRA